MQVECSNLQDSEHQSKIPVQKLRRQSRVLKGLNKAGDQQRQSRLKLWPWSNFSYFSSRWGSMCSSRRNTSCNVTNTPNWANMLISVGIFSWVYYLHLHLLKPSQRHSLFMTPQLSTFSLFDFKHILLLLEVFLKFSIAFWLLMKFYW